MQQHPGRHGLIRCLNLRTKQGHSQELTPYKRAQRALLQMPDMSYCFLAILPMVSYRLERDTPETDHCTTMHSCQRSTPTQLSDITRMKCDVGSTWLSDSQRLISWWPSADWELPAVKRPRISCSKDSFTQSRGCSAAQIKISMDLQQDSHLTRRWTAGSGACL